MDVRLFIQENMEKVEAGIAYKAYLPIFDHSDLSMIHPGCMLGRPQRGIDSIHWPLLYARKENIPCTAIAYAPGLVLNSWIAESEEEEFPEVSRIKVNTDRKSIFCPIWINGDRVWV